MDEQKMPVRIDLEDFTAVITRGALRALAAQSSESSIQNAAATSASFNPIIRMGYWFEVAHAGPTNLGGSTGNVASVSTENKAE